MFAFCLFAAVSAREALTNFQGETIVGSAPKGDGNTHTGGALYVSGSQYTAQVTIQGCRFRECNAQDGGAVYLWTVTCVVSGNSGTSFVSCSATRNGGAFYALGCKVRFETSVQFQRCTAEGMGGSIYAIAMYGFDSSKSLTIYNCKARQDGGAIWLQTSYETTSFTGRTNIEAPVGAGYNTKSIVYIEKGTVTLSGLEIKISSLVGATTLPLSIKDFKNQELVVKDCSFSKAGVRSGAIVASRSEAFSLTLNQCQFTNLQSYNGAINGGSAATLTITNCDFTTVEAEKGGAIHTESAGEVVIEDCTIKTATATKEGGGALFVSSTTTRVDIQRTTFDGNTYVGGSVRWNFGTQAEFVLENCTFKNHVKPTSSSSDQSMDCLIRLDPAGSATFPPVTLTKIIFFKNELVGMKGIISVTTTSLTFEDCVLTGTTVSLPAEKDSYKGLVFLEGGSSYSFSSCQFTDCKVVGKGGIIVSPEQTSPQTLADDASSINLKDCDFCGCTSDATPELSLRCSKLTITGGTYQCQETPQSSFIEIWITGTETENPSSVSATFIMDEQGSFQHPMIDFHSVENSKTTFERSSFEGKTQQPYIQLANDGDVYFAGTTFEAEQDSAVKQTEGSKGKVEFVEPKTTDEEVQPGSDDPAFSVDDTSTNTDQPTEPSKSNSALIGGIAGGIIGVAVVAGIIVVVILLLRQRKARKFDTSTGSCELEETNSGTTVDSLTVTESGPPVTNDSLGGEWENHYDLFTESFEEDHE